MSLALVNTIKIKCLLVLASSMPGVLQTGHAFCFIFCICERQLRSHRGDQKPRQHLPPC